MRRIASVELDDSVFDKLVATGGVVEFRVVVGPEQNEEERPAIGFGTQTVTDAVATTTLDTAPDDDSEDDDDSEESVPVIQVREQHPRNIPRTSEDAPNPLSWNLLQVPPERREMFSHNLRALAAAEAEARIKGEPSEITGDVLRKYLPGLPEEVFEIHVGGAMADLYDAVDGEDDE